MSMVKSRTQVERLGGDAKRLQEVLRVATRYGLGDCLHSIPIPGAKVVLEAFKDHELADQPIEARVRLALTDLGPTFVKIGQVLATRPDLVGPEMAAELGHLHADTPADPPEVVRDTIIRELGRPIEEVFAKLDLHAAASASIAQVHLGVLKTGEAVAVKVQKAGIETVIEADLSVLATLADLAETHSEKYKDWEPVRLVREFRRTLLDELDFCRELEHMEAFERNFACDPTVRFARTWPEFSSRCVLTMEYLPGILGTDEDGLKASGVDLNEFARRGGDAYLKMVFRDGFYHADPHPGNLMLLPGGVVGIVDCGMVGRINEPLREDLESLVSALTDENVEALTSTLWALAKGQPESARDSLRSDLAELTEVGHRSIGRIDIGSMLTGILGIFSKYRITPRPGMTQLLRMLALLNGTAQRLSPEFDLESLLRPYQEEAIKRRLDPRYAWSRLRQAFLEWDKLIKALPTELTSVLQRVRSGEFRVGLEHRHLDSVVNRLVLGLITSSLVLGSSLLWSLKAPPLVGGVSVLGFLGFAAAAVLGFVLYRAIRSTGKTVQRD